MPATATMSASMSAISRPMATVIVALRRIGLPLLRCRLRWRGLRLRSSPIVARATFDDLVEFAAIQPDSTAFGAIINLDALPFAHNQIHPASRAKVAVTFVACSSTGGVNHFSLPVQSKATTVLNGHVMNIGSLATRGLGVGIR